MACQKIILVVMTQKKKNIVIIITQWVIIPPLMTKKSYIMKHNAYRYDKDDQNYTHFLKVWHFLNVMITSRQRNIELWITLHKYSMVQAYIHSLVKKKKRFLLNWNYIL